MDIEARVKGLSTKVKWGLMALAAFIVAPIVFMIVKGLVGLAIAGLVGLAIINLAPVLSMKFANWKLKAIKHEAMVNPVETLQTVYSEKDQALSAFAQRIEDFATEVKNFEDQCTVFRKEHPEDAPKFEATLRAMESLLALRRQRLRDAREELKRFEVEIRKAGAIYKMAMSAQRLHKAAGMTEDSYMQKIKAGTAIESVQSSLNRAMAQLETAVDEGIPALENNPSDVIDATMVESAQTEVLPRMSGKGDPQFISRRT